MKPVTKTLPTGIKTVATKQKNGVIRITVGNSKNTPKLSKEEKYIVAPITLFTIMIIVGGAFNIYSELEPISILILSPLILFKMAVLTAVLFNLYFILKS